MSNVPNLEKYRLASRNLQTVEILIRNSVERENGCREWQKAINPGGYGVIHFKRQAMLVHRLSFWLFNGPIDEGDDVVVDHLCRNRRCIEPAHLRIWTRAENTADSWTAKKTHCKRGHPLSGDNVYRYVTGGKFRSRACKTCSKEKSKRYYDRKRELRQAALSAE